MAAYETQGVCDVVRRCCECGQPVAPLQMSCSRACALAYWRRVREQEGGIGVVDA